MPKRKGTYITDNILTKDYEQIHYEHPEVPYQTSSSTRISHSVVMGIPHWHNDIEMAVVTRGESIMEVAGEQFVIQKGDGYFINSRQIHTGKSRDRDFIYVRFHPILLCANEYIEKTFVAPVINDPNMTFIHLSKDIPWQKEILDTVRLIYEEDQKKNDSMPLMIESSIFRVWKILYDHREKEDRKRVPDSHHMSSLKQMIGFIQENYGNRITLQDIADAGHVSSSTCNIIFNSLVHQSPVRYLMLCRLKYSADMLEDTDRSVTEIAGLCGFPGTSYYSEMFHREYGMTPSQWRREIRRQQKEEDRNDR
ncbi:MAG: helix-turn-helix transcriptional regulator [Solobacterium sp.]|nr:helix-turn-helix transcriptional regulator [Solobacterium sp.]